MWRITGSLTNARFATLLGTPKRFICFLGCSYNLVYPFCYAGEAVGYWHSMTGCAVGRFWWKYMKRKTNGKVCASKFTSSDSHIRKAPHPMKYQSQTINDFYSRTHKPFGSWFIISQIYLRFYFKFNISNKKIHCCFGDSVDCFALIHPHWMNMVWIWKSKNDCGSCSSSEIIYIRKDLHAWAPTVFPNLIMNSWMLLERLSLAVDDFIYSRLHNWRHYYFMLHLVAAAPNTEIRPTFSSIHSETKRTA